LVSKTIKQNLGFVDFTINMNPKISQSTGRYVIPQIQACDIWNERANNLLIRSLELN